MIRAYDDNGNVVDLVEWEEEIRADERVKTIDELENKLRIWDNNVNAIPNYVWKCIKEIKGGAE